MTPRVRKFALTVHVSTSVGWLGSVAAFLALAVTGVATSDDRLVGAVYPAMDLEGRLVIVPLALAALGSGVVQAVGTPWGLVRHYWVVIKLLVTTVATVVLLLQLPAMAHLSEAAVNGTLAGGAQMHARAGLVVHSGGGLLVLLVPTVLSVYKPRGQTAFGRRAAATPVARAST